MALGYTGLMILIWMMWGLSFLTTFFRAGLRYYQRRKLFADDYFIFVGMATLTGLTAVITCMLPQFYLAGEYAKAAAVNPLTPIPLGQEEFTRRTIEAFKLMFSQMLLFWTTLWAAKFSILFSFRRLIHSLPIYLRWWWACLTTTLLLYLACLASNITTCLPPKTYPSATSCNTPSPLSIHLSTTADILADLLLMLLPLHLLRNLPLSTRQKVGLAILFSLGGVVIGLAFARMVQVTRAMSGAAADGPVTLSMWSHVEASVAIVVAGLLGVGAVLGGEVGRVDEGRYGAEGMSGGKTSRLGSWSGGEGEWGVRTEVVGLRPVFGRGIQKEVEYSVTEEVRGARGASWFGMR